MIDKKFDLLKKEYVKELDSTAYVYKHVKSGARVLIFSNKDNNKVFTIGFRTPPANDTGLPHIMEHSVLCGTRKYPVKEVFVELIKGSLNTFLNAFTFPDKTCYPFASCNDKDFANLMDVYMDAVLYPKIYERKEIFLQEGWHYEMTDVDKEISYNGVVYNEMKGAYSSPDRILMHKIQSVMFPDNAYQYESGGDPKAIIDLSYEEFINFHKKYYHPSNSYIFMYGNMDVEEKLEWLDKEYLSNFDKIEIDSEIKDAKDFEKPIFEKVEYPVGQEESTDEKAYLSYSTTVGSTNDAKTWMAFNILSYILLDMPGAPLKQALLDAKIGKDISSQYNDGIKEQYLSVVAKEASEVDTDRFIKVIEDELRKIVKEGIDKKAIEAAINRFEFKYREADFGRMPKGIIYMMSAMDSWLYDENDQFSHILTDEIFKSIKDDVDSGYFEKLIEKYILNNNHKAIVVAIPSKEIGQREVNKTSERLQNFKDTLTLEQKKQIIDDTANLKKYQSTPSSKEELSTVPMLSRKDLTLEVEPISNIEKEINGTKVIHHDIFTNGINYIDVLFNVKGLSNKRVSQLSLLASILTAVSTKNYTYKELNKVIDANFGSLEFSLNNYTQFEDYKLYFTASVSVLDDKIQKAYEVLTEIINNSILDDEKRLFEIISEVKVSLERKASNSGHIVSMMRSLSYQNIGYKVEDAISGIDYYNYITSLTKNYNNEKANLIKDLKELINLVFSKDIIVSFTGNKEQYDLNEKEISNFVKQFKESKIDNEFKFEKNNLNEGLKASFNVQYVARTGNYREKGYEYKGSLAVLNNMLSSDYLWNNVRVKGGAYGCMCNFNKNGTSFFVSYRDPKLVETIKVYESLPEYLDKFTADEEEMTKNIIGTIGAMDAPLTPAAQGRKALALYLNNISDEALKKERDEVINCKEQDIRDLKDTIAAILEADSLCVVGNEKKIEENKEIFKNTVSLFK